MTAQHIKSITGHDIVLLIELSTILSNLLQPRYSKLPFIPKLIIG